MPELPEVETSVQAIQEFSNQNIESIEIYNPNLRWKVDCKAFKNLSGLKVSKIDRRAKYIIFHLNHSQILIHLGMTGTLRIAKKESNFYKKHDHIEFIFDDEKIIYNDPRRFGSLHATKNVNDHKLIAGLGPEPLSNNFNAEYLLTRCKKSKSNIKTLIMNQKNVVGIGNIYACESLYLSKINPKKNSHNLNLQECKRIVDSAKKVLNEAIKVGGTTLKDFYSADGSPGYFKIKLNVYGREGQKCKKCKGEVVKVTINQRATFYCSSCQS